MSDLQDSWRDLRAAAAVEHNQTAYAELVLSAADLYGEHTGAGYVPARSATQDAAHRQPITCAVCGQPPAAHGLHATGTLHAFDRGGA